MLGLDNGGFGIRGGGFLDCSLGFRWRECRGFDTALGLEALRAAISVAFIAEVSRIGAGASRSSSSVSSAVSSSDSDLFRPEGLGARSNGLSAVYEGLGSDLEYPAAALVLDFTPWRPVKEFPPFLGLVVISPWRAVPRQCSPSFSSNVERSLSSDVGLGARVPLSRSNMALFFASRASASFFLLVSARRAVMESVGREMVDSVEAFRTLASFLRRTYSAWWRCWVKVRATA